MQYSVPPAQMQPITASASRPSIKTETPFQDELPHLEEKRLKKKQTLKIETKIPPLQAPSQEPAINQGVNRNASTSDVAPVGYRHSYTTAAQGHTSEVRAAMLTCQCNTVIGQLSGQIEAWAVHHSYLVHSIEIEKNNHERQLEQYHHELERARRFNDDLKQQYETERHNHEATRLQKENEIGSLQRSNTAITQEAEQLVNQYRREAAQVKGEEVKDIPANRISRMLLEIAQSREIRLIHDKLKKGKDHDVLQRLDALLATNNILTSAQEDHTRQNAELLAKIKNRDDEILALKKAIEMSQNDLTPRTRKRRKGSQS